MVPPAGRDRPHGDQHQAQKRPRDAGADHPGAEQRGFGERFAFLWGSGSRRGRDRAGRRAADSGRLLRGIAAGRRLWAVVRSALLVLFERSRLGEPADACGGDLGRRRDVRARHPKVGARRLGPRAITRPRPQRSASCLVLRRPQRRHSPRQERSPCPHQAGEGPSGTGGRSSCPHCLRWRGSALRQAPSRNSRDQSNRFSGRRLQRQDRQPGVLRPRRRGRGMRRIARRRPRERASCLELRREFPLLRDSRSHGTRAKRPHPQWR